MGKSFDHMTLELETSFLKRAGKKFYFNIFIEKFQKRIKIKSEIERMG